MEIFRSGLVFIRVETQLAHIHSSLKVVGHFVHLAKSDSEKFLRSFFQKATKKNGAFLFAKLFLLRLLCQKKKR